MRSISLTILVVLAFSSVPSSKGDLHKYSRSNLTNSEEWSAGVNDTERRGKQLEIDRIEIPFSGREVKRQVIKIPPNVSKVKLIRSGPNQRTNRGTATTNWFPNALQSPETNIPFEEHENPFNNRHSLYSSNERRNSKRHKVNDGGVEEFYEGNNIFSDDHPFGVDHSKYKKFRNSKKWIKDKKKISVAGYHKDYLYSMAEKFRSKDDINYGTRNPHEDSESDEYFDHEAVGSTRFLQQAMPNDILGLTTVNPSNGSKPPFASEKPFQGKYRDMMGLVSGLSVNRMPPRPSTRLSFFNQQYTTHNPHVLTNFGLKEFNNYRFSTTAQYLDSSMHGRGKAVQPTQAASEQVFSVMPILTPGIQVIKPSGFGDVTASRSVNPSSVPPPSHHERNSQKATISDILQQDCPNHEQFGFCGSPPRYPTFQINSIVQKCSSLLDILTAKIDDEQRINGFASKGEANMKNNTDSADLRNDQHLVRKRSAKALQEGTAACQSDFILIEPGYAREVTTGKWFVIVQHPEMAPQKITTDSCKSPGKPCGGLYHLKCLSSINKSTKCVQRFSFHRLISWDPDTPDACPRMRIFKFPSACVCHARLV